MYPSAFFRATSCATLRLLSALAAAVAANGPLSLIASKQVASESAEWRRDEMWERQAVITTPVFESQDAREGAAAFAEKRKPVWKGQ